MKTTIVLWIAVLELGAALPCAAAQTFAFPSAAADDRAVLTRAMPKLAAALIAAYEDGDRQAYLDNLFRLQIVAGQFDGAAASLSALRRYDDDASPWSATNYSQYAIFVSAKQSQASGKTFDQAFETSFHRIVGSSSDVRSALILRRFQIGIAPLQDDLRLALQRQRGASAISLDDALALVRDYQLVDMYQTFATRVGPLIADDDRRRYIIQQDLLIKTGDGAQICTLVIRPRAHSDERLPALLQFTIYASRIPNFTDARRSASNGYVGVEALTRGKGCSPDAPVPYMDDGADAVTVIDWIARQPWSDGRVGMFGGSYNSFVQWSAAKRAPHALKALMTSVSNAPGIDTPMENNVFQSFSYDWPFYTTTGKWLDASTQGDPTHWIALRKQWYVSGRSYRSMDKIDGRPNPIWDRWLDHPSYDAFWQQFIPYRQDFAHIRIPVLSTDGYLAGQNVGGLYYFRQYTRYNPSAPIYFVVGPYDHVRGQRGTVSSMGPDLNVVAGYPIDPAAHIDIESLRYQWFDHIFKGAKMPAILGDKVNYEVMGANEWRHSPTIEAMHDELLTFRLSASDDGAFHRLTQERSPGDAFVSQTVDFADRADVNGIPSAAGLDTHLGVAYQSPPFGKPVDLAGVFSGQLDFVTNKKDFDVNVGLYELTAQHAYVGVTYYQGRASYVRDRTRRQLLVPGQRTRLAFTSSRFASWRFHAGSRLVVVISIVREPDIQINYGTGEDVSDETIADAKIPLKIKWFADSFIAMPAWR
jgi:putative CocE/NonD family hydrolase